MSATQEARSIVDVIRNLLAEALGVEAAQIGAQRTFFELGLTSRIGVIWMARINKVYGLSMPAVRAYNYPTLEKLAGRIQEELAARAAGATAAGKVPAMFGKRGNAGGRSQGVGVQPAENSMAVHHGRDTRPANASSARRAITFAKSSGRGTVRGDTAIAIVGMSGCFPRARNKVEFWQAIVEGRDCVSRVSRPYWKMGSVYSPTPQPRRTYSEWLGAVDDIDRFDPLFFNISPADADRMDPQQRLLLQEAWRCLEDAGLRVDTLAGRRCGVFIGCGTYGQSQNGQDLSAAGFLGASPSILAARIAYLLDLRGPCITLDTACSASLVAIAQACDSLMLGDSDLALAGGVSILADPSIHIMASQAGMLSPQGRCFSFDQRANGFVPGEGVGVVALKRLDDALRDGDHIYGKVIGWGINQDGKTNGITAPSQASQCELQQMVFRKFGIDPRSIGLMEAHGSGTKLGDPIEVEALVDAFRSFTDATGYCALGSVKSNVGHLLAAAGVAGFFKALLALKHQTLPPSIHFETLNEHIKLDGSPFFINTTARPWLADAFCSRRAAVSSFGFSGTNAYVVLEEHEAAPRAEQSAQPPAREVIVLSAHDDERLRVYAQALADAIRRPGYGGEPLRIDDIAHTLQVGRATLDARLAIISGSIQELAASLAAFIAGRNDDPTVFHGRVANGDDTLIDTNDIPTIVERWIAGGQLDRLAQCWVKYGFDWRGHQTWRARIARRIDLPTYPFEPRLCEMPVFGLASQRIAQDAVSPLVHTNISTFDQVAFSSTFDGTEFFFDDHVIVERKTLPGVAYLEIACIAGCIATGKRVSALRNVVWLRPFQIDSTSATLVIRVKRNGKRMTFEIVERALQQERLCAQGELAFDDAGTRGFVALDERLLHATFVGGPDDCYARFDAQGFAYGPAFRGIRALYQSGADLIARIEYQHDARMRYERGGDVLSDHYTLLDGFVLHPGLLDSAFQPCIRFCEARHPTRTFIPYALSDITVFDSLPARFYSIATLKHIDDENAHFSIEMVDDTGVPLVRIDDLMLRPVNAVRPAYAPEHPIHLYRMDWTDAASYVGAATRERARKDARRLVFLPAGFAMTGNAREQDIVVCPGQGFGVLGERRYEIDPRSAADYAQLWEAVVRPMQPLEIVHAWALADEPSPHDEAAAVERTADRLGRSLYSLTYLAQQLVRHRALKQSALLCVHRCAGGYAAPAHLAVSGLLRSFAVEQPDLLIRSVGYESTNAHTLTLDSLVQRELAIPHLQGEAIEIRYAGDQRLALTARHMADAGLEHDASGAPKALGVGGGVQMTARLRKSGVYLISGGAGGLGLMLAEALVRRYDARVVLTGRTVFEALAAPVRERICALGDAHAHYIVADVTHEQSVAMLVDAARARFQRLHGVFHCAGAMANAAVTDKTADAIARIVEPKILGAILLDRATCDDALDLFVVYSSIASVMRFAGQTDYGYANRFLDGFATHRQALVRKGLRNGRTLSVVWSLWRDGGMTLDDAKVQLLERLHGLVPLDASSGLNALEACLVDNANVSADHVVVVRGRADEIEANWPECVTREHQDAPPAPRAKPTCAGTLADQVLAELATLLKLEASNIDPDKNLMQYGLDSISAMVLINKVNDAFYISVQPAALLRHPTLNEFVAHLQAEHWAECGDADAPNASVASLAAESVVEHDGDVALDVRQADVAVQERGDADAKFAYPDPYLAPIVTPSEGLAAVYPWPMTRGQHALWFLHQLNGANSAYHIAVTFRLRSPLDMAAFEHSYAELLRRHPALRANFRNKEGHAEQLVRETIEPDLRRVDCAGMSTDAILEAMQDAHRCAFDLTRDALSRVRVFVRNESDAFVLWTVHHLVSDAWSQWVLLDELLARYAARRRGEALELAPLKHTFADFANDEARFLASDAGRRQIEFWQRQLGGQIPVLNLPTDYPRPRVQTFNGASVPVVCDTSMSDALRQLARQQAVTPFAVLLGAYQCLLGRYSGERSIWVGSPVSGRIDEQYADLVGYFINSIVLTADLGANLAFSEFIQQQQRIVVDALEHQRVPFSRLVELLNPSREGGRTPLFQAEFVYQKAHKTGELIRILSPEAGVAIEYEGLQLESVPFAQQEGQTDICLEMTQIDERFVGSFKFNSDLFAPATMRSIRDGFMTLLAAAVAHPDTPIHALPIGMLKGRVSGLTHLEGPRGPSVRSTVMELIEQQAAETPDAQAVIDGHTAWTYRMLNERANRIAHHLRARGLAPGGRVALCMRRSADVVATLLAVMKAGGTYVPMDAAFPVERLQLMLDDAAPALVVTDHEATLPNSLTLGGAALVDLDAQSDEISLCPATPVSVTVPLDSIAYVIYTSGSTGRPKGVQIPHSALTNFLLSMRDKPGMSARDRLLAVTTISFDIAGLELYLPLVSGAVVVLASRDDAMDGLALQRRLAEHRITMMQATPTTWQMLVESGWQGAPGFTILCGGEPLPRVLAQRLSRCGARVWNLYGPTETTIWSCIGLVVDDGEQAVEPIGEPIRNTSLHIVDDALQPVSAGTIGELCIGGDGVATGYLNRPELNVQKFVQTRWGRLYRTGDLVRLTHDGKLEFHGRTDHQLKIRGFRVEAAEIEHLIRSDERIADCVVTVWNRSAESGVEGILTAYLVMKQRTSWTDAIKAQLRERIGHALPAYMVPSVFVVLDVFPLTPNNKVDRKALPQPDAVSPSNALSVQFTHASHAQPAGRDGTVENDARIEKLWCEVLQLDNAPADSHFFVSGGTSFSASRLMYLLRRDLAITVPVSLLFEHPTLADFSRQVRVLMPAVPPAADANDPLLEILERVRHGHLSVDHATRLIDEIQ
ncbi:amino acid adenylation domain-containing protein [Mycetohabitans sp. B8]|uniref:Polyketide synthase NecE n=1 Tax=Burkholderia sp. B8(2020) TaxID=2713619 RepID=A0A6G6CWV2_9BURK|nr:non-ribosomal peptide synthetase [Mycetohabitans sp. B8]MCG1043600.1 amino acid adenylation domain-containing protein [Mycetohabitans sp. B8]QIE07364.1 polyketide synthase NecE [Burkholderia sp. B8(2020)]